MLSEGNRYLEQQKFRKKGENKIKHSDSLYLLDFVNHVTENVCFAGSTWQIGYRSVSKEMAC